MATPYTDTNTNGNSNGHVTNGHNKKSFEIDRLELKQEEHKLEVARLEKKAELEAAQKQVDHENLLSEIQARNAHDVEKMTVVGQLIASLLTHSIDAYERVQKTKLADQQARFNFILELSKVDRELAVDFMKNEGRTVAFEAGHSGARQVMGQLAGALRSV